MISVEQEVGKNSPYGPTLRLEEAIITIRLVFDEGMKNHSFLLYLQFI